MARIARIVIPNIPHHVTQRGNRSQRVFFSDKDKTAYLNLLHRYAQNAGLTFWAYCLMDNHIHLIAVPKKEDSLAKGIGDTHKYYTRMVNFRENCESLGVKPWYRGTHHLIPIWIARSSRAMTFISISISGDTLLNSFTRIPGTHHLIMRQSTGEFIACHSRESGNPDDLDSPVKPGNDRMPPFTDRLLGT